MSPPRCSGHIPRGYRRYLAAGRSRSREGGFTPRDWNERIYLQANRDVEDEVRKGVFLNGYHHYLVAGRHENREGGFIPRDWDESAYLEINQDVQYQITQGLSSTATTTISSPAEPRNSSAEAGRGARTTRNISPPTPQPASASRWANIKPVTRIMLRLDAIKDCRADCARRIPWNGCGNTGQSSTRRCFNSASGSE